MPELIEGSDNPPVEQVVLEKVGQILFECVNFLAIQKPNEPKATNSEPTFIDFALVGDIYAVGTLAAPQPAAASQPSESTPQPDEAVVALGWPEWPEFKNPFEKPPETVHRKVAETLSVEEEEKKLLQVLKEQLGSEGDLQVKELEDKIKKFKDHAQLTGLTDQEVAETLKEIRLMLEPDQAAISLELRVRLAIQILEHATDPKGIDQGGHNTCTVTTVEEHMYTVDPSAAAAVIRQMAVDGYYIAPDGTKVVLPPGSLDPDWEAQFYPTLDGKRDYTSQILQLTMINYVFQSKNPPEFYHQELGLNEDGEVVHLEVIRNAKGEKIRDFTGLYPEETEKVATVMFGNANFVISRNFDYKEDLDNYLRQQWMSGNWPVALIVFGGGHVISIADYNPETGMYYISNQWGQHHDKWISLADLWAAKYPPYAPKLVIGPQS